MESSKSSLQSIEYNELKEKDTNLKIETVKKDMNFSNT